MLFTSQSVKHIESYSAAFSTAGRLSRGFITDYNDCINVAAVSLYLALNLFDSETGETIPAQFDPAQINLQRKHLLSLFNPYSDAYAAACHKHMPFLIHNATPYAHLPKLPHDITLQASLAKFKRETGLLECLVPLAFLINHDCGVTNPHHILPVLAALPETIP